MKSTETQHSESKWQEVEQLRAAGERLVQRAKEDPNVAEKFLRDIGYYEAMAHQKAEEEAASAQAAPRAEAPAHPAISNGKPPTRQP